MLSRVCGLIILTFLKLKKITYRWVGTGKREWSWGQVEFFIAAGVLPLELLTYNVQQSALQISQASSMYIHLV